MRPIYFLLKITLNISFRLFYARIRVINKPSKFFSRTIYVSNHPNSFMDPILLGALNRPVVHFMTRSDVFKWWLKPVLWASHMLPIYRQHDGEDTRSKNSDVFNRVNKSLSLGRNILIFGEGFTDDVPIRGLKPIKKGPVRMGFTALEACNWTKKIHLAAIGINYTDRNQIGSDLIIENGKTICLNDYKDAFRENPNRTINELTKIIEQYMQEAVIFVQDQNWYSLHENIMQITRKGFNHANHDSTIDLMERYRYSKNLAKWINEHASEESTQLSTLKKELESYFSLEKRMRIEDRFVVAASSGKLLNSTREKLALLTVWPLAIVGFIHGFIPYISAKKMTEKMMRRKVFWGSVKMMLGKLFGSILNIPATVLITHYFLPHWSLGIPYFLFVIPITWRISYAYMGWIKEVRKQQQMNHVDLTKFIEKRNQLVAKIMELVPVA
jgi:1-acyl-sn-glycerol-3-phosphate acyltransferase